ncbi:MAG: hypothetical protein D6741_09410, partial [Planctomycetota bacterium]
MFRCISSRWVSIVGLWAAVLFLPLACAAQSPQTSAPDWIEAMRRVHSRCEGQPGVVLQVGDSITDSLAFFAPLEYAAGAKLPPEATDALPVLRHYIRKECYRWKGGEYGNASGQTAGWAVQH